MALEVLLRTFFAGRANALNSFGGGIGLFGELDCYEGGKRIVMRFVSWR